jgi:hypothetical protein
MSDGIVREELRPSAMAHDADGGTSRRSSLFCSSRRLVDLLQ